MPLHLLKMSVGVDEVGELVRGQAARLARQRAASEAPRIQHLTRHRPQRAAEILDGGSIYWVIRGCIRVRQRIIAIERLAHQAPEGKRCALVLDPALVRTEPQPRRPHQGWRYLADIDAPPDLDGAAAAGVPPELAAELRTLGLL